MLYIKLIQIFPLKEVKHYFLRKDLLNYQGIAHFFQIKYWCLYEKTKRNILQMKIVFQKITVFQCFSISDTWKSIKQGLGISSTWVEYHLPGNIIHKNKLIICYFYFFRLEMKENRYQIFRQLLRQTLRATSPRCCKHKQNKSWTLWSFSS